MYKFRKLKAEYILRYTIILPDSTESIYSARIGLLASYNNQNENYTFELTNRYDIKLNDAEPINEVDKFMIHLSESLYPIKLCVSKSGLIECVINFNDIKGRWEKRGEEILKESYSLVLDNYISISKDNMKDEKSFLKSLYKDSFIQFYFAPVDSEYFDFICYNIPGQQGNVYFDNMKLATDSILNVRIYLLEDDLYNGKVRYEFSELMDRQSIYAEFNFKGNGESYTKKFSITSDINTKEIKKSNKFISFLAD